MDPPPKRVHGVPWQAGHDPQARPSLGGKSGAADESEEEMEGKEGEVDGEEVEEGIPDLDSLLPESTRVPPKVRSCV